MRGSANWLARVFGVHKAPSVTSTAAPKGPMTVSVVQGYQQCVRVKQVIDGDNIDIWSAFQYSEDRSADSSESVNGYSHAPAASISVYSRATSSSLAA